MFCGRETGDGLTNRVDAKLRFRVFEMKRRGYPEGQIQHMVFDNPVQFLGQSANFKIEQKPLTEPRLEGAALNPGQ